MATTYAEIDAAAMVLIDDVRLAEQIEISPALYYRRMSFFVDAALPLLSRPPELLQYLTRTKVEPTYGEASWESTEASKSGETVVQTGMTDFDICSCVVTQTLDDGRVLQTPYAVSYDSITGNVTFPQQTAAGINYDLDFYKDGSFGDLTATQVRLFALAVALVWDERFVTNWLNRQPKINDSSFTTVNEANWTEKTSQAHLRKEQAFHDEMKHYEQMCAYESVVSNGAKGSVTLV